MIKKGKRILYIVFSSVLLIFIVSFLKNKSSFLETETFDQKVLGLPTEEKATMIDISFAEKKYRVNWYKIENIDDLTLTANFGKYTSLEFYEKNNCEFLTSGGYYKVDYSPTGLLISEYQEMSPFVFAFLTNGIFSVNDFATPRITSLVPKDRLRIALQAGPLLKENGEFKELSLKQDEEARRVVVAVSGENKAYFLILYDPESVLMGPFLEDLPKIIYLFEKETGIAFADVLNLDGGSPTVFMENEVNLPESSLVGSFFCLK